MTETISKTKKHRLRTKAAAKLYHICSVLGFRCWWCHRPLVVRRSIPEEAIHSENGDTLTWLGRNNVLQKMHKATVDHVQPLSEGGGNDEANLVPSCGACNRERTGSPEKWAKKLPTRRAQAFQKLAI